MTDKLSIKDLPLQNKKVMMRVDFNVPLDADGHITDDTRISSSIPSINYILNQGGSLILMSHLGRPKGKVVPGLSLKPCAKRLATLLGREVLFAPDCLGAATQKMVNDLNSGDILLLENLRFYEGEEHPEKHGDFAAQLAKLGDFFVNDAFGTCHRAHASTVDLPQLFSGKAAAGLLLEKEIQFLGKTLLEPKRPFYAILGGAKISSKIGIISSLLKKANAVLIGGGMAFTFLKAKGYPIGDSICEENFLDQAKKLISSNPHLRLPEDIVIAPKIQSGVKTQIVQASEGIPQGFYGVDIGPKTSAAYTGQLHDAATVLWNGPMGIFEISEFAKGTHAIAEALTGLRALTIVGGGDSIAAVQSMGISKKISHLSTGGGASLEFIESGTLPGIEALTDKFRT